ncbi:MAG: efflux RND transporter permease subunit [Bacteroidales bacterium]
MNSSVLPIGFKAKAEDYGWGVGESKKIVWILLYIIVVIYLVCAVLFESLVQPFIIILLIPMSFIGVLLTFYFTGFSFDQGGFASLVMLSGIVVNAGIYIINQSNLQ